MTTLTLHILRKLAGSAALLVLLIFSPQMMRADTTADAATPTIISQPQDATVYQGGEVILSVNASVSDNGTLSYQWYHTSSLEIRATPISGATLKSYSLEARTVGTSYFYVVVTNTNSSATGAKTATVTSRTATVTVTPPPVCSIGTTTYTSLDDALTAITTNAPTTIKLLTSITHSDGCTLSNKKISFDLNGKDLLFTGGTGAPALKLTNCTIDYTGTGNFKVISTGHDGLNISGGSCTLTYAETSNSSGWSSAVFCSNGGNVTVNGNVTATNNGNNNGINTYDAGSAILVNGDVSSTGTGVGANNGGAVIVIGNITADADAIHASGGLSVSVTGNVATTGLFSGIYCDNSNVQINVGGVVSSSSGWGIFAVSGNIRVGSVNASNGVLVSNKGTTVIVDGTINAKYNYIQLNGVNTIQSDGKTDTTNPGYLKYTDGTSTVWVKIVNAATPTINNQPQGATVSVGNAVTLSVTASVSDNGTLSYQWYQTSSLVLAGTPISGDTASSYSPPTKTAGTYYYYVVVANTNNSATGAKTATAISNTATVTVIAVASPFCSIGTTTYTSLDDALATVPTGGTTPTTIKLLANIDYNGQLTVDNKKITFDLNSKNLNVNANGMTLLVENGGSVSLSGVGNFNLTSTGTFSSNSDGYFCTYINASPEKATVTNLTGANCVAFARQGGELNVQGNVTVTSATGIGAYADDFILDRGGKITIDGTITVPAGATYIKVGTTTKTKADYEAVTTKSGYLTYTDGSNTVWVKSTGGTGIENVSQAIGLKAWVENGTLHVGGLIAGKFWSVYTTTGAPVYNAIAGSENEEVRLDAKGVYIIRSENKTVKIRN